MYRDQFGEFCMWIFGLKGLRLQDEEVDYEDEIFSILCGARAWTSVIRDLTIRQRRRRWKCRWKISEKGFGVGAEEKGPRPSSNRDSQVNLEFGHFTPWQGRQSNVQKSVTRACRVVVFLTYCFLTFPLPSPSWFRKVPILAGKRDSRRHSTSLARMSWWRKQLSTVKHHANVRNIVGQQCWELLCSFSRSF